MQREITIELTDFCPNACKFCSSEAGVNGMLFLNVDKARELLEGHAFDVINLSGGEPLAHPRLWDFIVLSKAHLTPRGELWLYTNMLDGIRYNLHVRDGVKIHANVTPDRDTSVVHILRRQRHGREAERPRVKQSGEDCSVCTHKVIRPDGTVDKPCKKESKKEDDDATR